MADSGRTLRSRTKAQAQQQQQHEVAAPAAAAPPRASTAPEAEPPAAVDPHAKEDELEFGGAVGTFAMMTGFPLLFYYLYVCLYFHDGASFLPQLAVNAQETADSRVTRPAQASLQRPSSRCR